VIEANHFAASVRRADCRGCEFELPRKRRERGTF
jgi:hypothetical protein